MRNKGVGRLSLAGKMGAGPGCLTQIELTAAILAATPAFSEPRSTGAVRIVAAPLGLLAAVGCFWALALFNWHVLRRLLYDASDREIPRPEGAKNRLALLAMVLLSLGMVPCWVLGHEIVTAATILVGSPLPPRRSHTEPDVPIHLSKAF